MERIVALSAGAIALLAGTANAAITATFTADNHYSIYSVNADGTTLTLQGGNELGPDGQPGQYNWSLPETYTFDSSGFVYIAAWSDDFFAQGLLGQITGDANIVTGAPQWRVFRTGLDLDDNSAYPTPALMQAQIAIANSNPMTNWLNPAVGQANVMATTPWGQVPGITPNARWTWAPLANGGDPFQPGTDNGEFLIFCAPIPTPGAVTLAGLGLAATLRRNRRK